MENGNKKRANYKGIEFAPGYNKSLKEFKEEFGKTHIFKKIPQEERESEFKKAHKIATDGNTIKSTTEG